MVSTHDSGRRPLKILISTQSIVGYQNYIRFMHFGRRLAQRGHSVTLFTTADHRSVRPGRTRVDGVELFINPGVGSWRLRRGALCPLDVALRVGHVLCTQYDLIHCDGHRPATSLQAIAGRTRFRTPWISEWVDLFGEGGIADTRPGTAAAVARALESRWEVRTRLRANAVIAISHALLSRALDAGVPPERLAYIPGGADIERVPIIDRDEARTRLGISPDVMLVCIAGYDDADRGDAIIPLHACGRLRQRHSDLRLLVTGTRRLAPADVSAAGMDGAVLSPGWVSEADYPIWLAAADVFALPLRPLGRNECKWPMKVGDYLAAGRPIVTNPTGEMVPLASEQGIGALVPCSVDGFVRGLGTLLEDPEMRRRIGAKNRKRAEDHFSWSHLTNRLEATYYAVKAGRPLAPVLRGPA